MDFLVILALAFTAVAAIVGYRYFRRGLNENGAGARGAARLIAVGWMFGGTAALILAIMSFGHPKVLILICAALGVFVVACCLGEMLYKREHASATEQDDTSSL
jgi:hypothetical protein